MQDETIEEVIKRISIRGRLAFGIKCIEQYVFENKISNRWIDKLIDTLWEFTSSTQLDFWESKIRDLEPINILDNHPDNVPSNYSLTESDFYELRAFYQSLSKDFTDLIDYTIEIGTGNLYGGTGKYSEFTLKPTIKVYELSNRLLNKVPDINKFLMFGYMEGNGWGRLFNGKALQL